MRAVAVAWTVTAVFGSAVASAQGSPATASAASAPVAPGFAAQVVGRLHANLRMKAAMPGNPVAEVEIRLGPDGTIIARR